MKRFDWHANPHFSPPGEKCAPPGPPREVAFRAQRGHAMMRPDKIGTQTGLRKNFERAKYLML
ncbi:MAG: hypothetical protein A2X46_16440 [Lentisphaerae bacterium GWF2_57_35]|nr:MAG: hypothetical protein A2X46_16440 [Lentisphaerae bacterium GWF2_57_35]